MENAAKNQYGGFQFLHVYVFMSFFKKKNFKINF